MASADVATAKAKATLINDLIIVSSNKRPQRQSGPSVVAPGALHREQLTAMRGGLTAEEYRWKLIREC